MPEELWEEMCKAKTACSFGHGPWALVDSQDPGVLTGKVRVSDNDPSRNSFSLRELLTD